MNYLSFNALYKGLKKSCNNVRWKTSVTQYEINAVKNTAKIIDDISSGKYKISDYQIFEIFEPKKRTICATRIKDRHFQRSLCDRYFYPELARHFIYDNCACQIGKGNVFAVNRMKAHLQKFYRKNRKVCGYYLKCDIHHFFDSIRHDVAKTAVEKRIPDLSVRQYIYNIIDSFDGDTGIGLGSQVSQLIALAVLDDMDHMIKERFRIKHYVRYMDDFILIHEDRAHLEYCLAEIKKHLSGIGLELNNKTSLQPLKHGFIFLHWRFILSNTGKVIMKQEKSRTVRRRRKLSKMMNLVKRGELNYDIVDKSVQGMTAHLSHGNCWREIRGIHQIVHK